MKRKMLTNLERCCNELRCADGVEKRRRHTRRHSATPPHRTMSKPRRYCMNNCCHQHAQSMMVGPCSLCMMCTLMPTCHTREKAAGSVFRTGGGWLGRGWANQPIARRCQWNARRIGQCRQKGPRDPAEVPALGSGVRVEGPE